MTYNVAMTQLNGVKETYKVKILDKSPTDWEASNLYTRDITDTKEVFKDVVSKAIADYAEALKKISLPSNYTKTASKVTDILGYAEDAKNEIKTILEEYIDNKSKDAFEEGKTIFYEPLIKGIDDMITEAESIVGEIKTAQQNATKATAADYKSTNENGEETTVYGTCEGKTGPEWLAERTIKGQALTAQIKKINTAITQVEENYIMPNINGRELGRP